MKIKKLLKNAIVVLIVFSLFSPSLIIFSYPRESSATIPVVDAGVVANTALIVAEQAVFDDFAGAYMVADATVQGSQFGQEVIINGSTWWDALSNAWAAFTNAITSWSTMSTMLKEFVLDGVARSLAQVMIRKITESTVQWINGGFQGGPGFLTNPTEFFTGTIDDALGEALSGAGLSWMCNSFGANIRIKLYQRNYRYQPPRCSLSTMANNAIGSVRNSSIRIDNSINNGGTVTVGAQPGSSQSGSPGSLGQIDTMSWGDFLGTTAEPANTPFGSMMIAAEQVRVAINQAKDAVNTELDRGGGLFSWKECTVTDSTRECLQYENAPTSYTTIGQPGTGFSSQTSTCIKYSEPKCTNWVTKTPGSVIQNQLDSVLGSDVKQLEVADEINEVLSALMGQVIKQVMGAAGGLLGLSDNGSNGKSKMSNFSADAEIASLQQQQQSQADYDASKAANDKEIADQQANIMARAIAGNDIATSTKATDSAGNKDSVSLSKPATQSSTSGSNVASLAVDGNRSATDNDFSSTNSEDAPWWKVDLYSLYKINQISIWFAGNDPKAIMTGTSTIASTTAVNNDLTVFNSTPIISTSTGKYIIKISDLNNNVVWTSDEISVDRLTTNPVTISVATSSNSLLPGSGSPVTGRFVTIEKVDGGVLQLAEVEVLAEGSSKAVFDENDNLKYNIVKNNSAQSINFNKTLTMSSDGAVFGLRLITGLIKQPANNADITANDYVDLSTIFSSFSTEVKRERTQANSGDLTLQEILDPATVQDRHTQIFEIMKDLTVENGYTTSLNISGQLNPTSSLPAGNYILRTELRDKNNNQVGFQDISFTVSVL
jgi:hypothetical protein